MRLESDYITFQETLDAADSAKKRLLKAEFKKVNKLSDESANLLSPN